MAHVLRILVVMAGCSAVLIYRDQRKEFVQGSIPNTTSNRMELQACILALNALKEPCEVTIYSDSKYVVNMMSKNHIVGVNANVDLIEELRKLCRLHRVTFNWIPGHNGDVENERCDYLAKQAAFGSTFCSNVIRTVGEPPRINPW